MSRELTPLPGNAARGLDAPQARIPVVNATAESAAATDVFLTFGEVFGALWAAKGRVTILAAAGAAVALAVAFSQPPVYQAKALIEVQGINENFLNHRDIDPTVEAGSIEIESYLQTQIKIIETDSLLGSVADRLHLERSPEFQPRPGMSGRILAAFRPRPAAEPANVRPAVIAAMEKALTVRLSGETHIIEVAFESYSPRTAAAVANAIAEEYIARNLDKRLSATEHTAAWLSGQLTELKGNLDQAEAGLERYVMSHDLLYTGDEQKDSVAEARLRQLQSSFTTAQEARFTEQSHYELVAATPVDKLSDAVDSETMRAYQAKLTELREKYAEARAVYTPEHYKVKQIQGQMNEVSNAIERERQALLNRLKGQYTASVRREKLIQSDLDSQAGVVRAQSAGAVEYNTLKRSVETYRKLYDSTLERVKETELAAAIRANNVQMAESANLPMAPVRPSKPMYGAVGMFAGLVAGLVMAMGRDRRQRQLRVPGEIAARLGLHELGSIPSAAIDLPYSVKEAAGIRDRLRACRRIEPPPGVRGEFLRDWLETVTWRQRESALAESYRGVLASLMHSGAEAPRVVAVTSATEGEGKTTTATNLAIALAESGRRVLVIDADRRRPHLDGIFRVPNHWGLSDYLLETTPTRLMDIARLVSATDVPNLFVLPAGTDRSCVPNLVDNARAADLLAALGQRYDTIVIDTPPMLALSDARGIGRMTDGVVLVVRAGHTPEQLLLAMAEKLALDGTPVLGAVLNDWKPARGSKASDYQRAEYSYRASGSYRS
ncbi:MAG: polysaccharide biosynthesis tyrosine autokinase [Bryobacteraceae bacterium]|jgi:capsular exopolysaccharide synthesis family protein